MDAIIAWIVANPELAIIIADVILGAIPDKWISYRGGVREVLKRLSDVLEK